MVPYRKIQSIIAHTEGGRALLEPHRRLVHKALHETVSRDGLEVIDWLHESITRGTYRKEFFKGIEHLTRDAKGLMFWKEHLIGRLALTDDAADEREARRLAERCRALEEKRFPITQRALLSREIVQAPADTPWQQALYTYAMFFGKADRLRAAFWAKDGKQLVVLEKLPDGSVGASRMESASGKALQETIDSQGLEVFYVGSYAQFERLMIRSKLTPADIARALG